MAGPIMVPTALVPGSKAMPMTAFSGPRSSAVISFEIGTTLVSSPKRNLRRASLT